MRMTSGEEELGKLLAYVTITTANAPASLSGPWECSMTFSIDTGRDQGGLELTTNADAPMQTGTTKLLTIAADAQQPVRMRVVPLTGHFSRKDGCPMTVNIILTRAQ